MSMEGANLVRRSGLTKAIQLGGSILNRSMMGRPRQVGSNGLKEKNRSVFTGLIKTLDVSHHRKSWRSIWQARP